MGVMSVKRAGVSDRRDTSHAMHSSFPKGLEYFLCICIMKKQLGINAFIKS